MENALKKQVGGEHYKHFKIQPVEFITANKLGFLEGCIIKRLCRYQSKGGLEDLKKIQHEIELLILWEYPGRNLPVTKRKPTENGGIFADGVY